ncbi:SDR family oxidoreductase [Hufsiella ginkgonis]|uniref:SDR family NAD(P)-dependent oxidoreductase n=1 Tax=Hufsiella ginkgonis TaxID=2695274 RepID=A0A7K1XXE7_9SPHI|nr:SDR family oxidoreductase [Hufsiella ginkgonis]MXV15681.1 SDR family NAD(P)-dependent oxidoreductase [Hufsiella ginkgonis]
MFKTISILGCGWYGLPLAESLVGDGFTVKGSTTSADKLDLLGGKRIQPFLIELGKKPGQTDPGFFTCDVLIVTLPPKRGRDGAEDYLTRLEYLKKAAIRYKVPRLIFTSSTGVYGDHNSIVDEDTPPQPDSDSGKLLLNAENLLRSCPEFKTTVIRFGGLIGPGRDPGRFFAGKKQIANGKAPVNLVQLYDCIGITKAILVHDAFGDIFNACSADHPEKKDFYERAANISGLPVPEFIDELILWKLVLSKKAESVLGYKFDGLA